MASPGGLEPALTGLAAASPERYRQKLERADRVRLAAACRPLRATSVHWFRGEVFELDALEAPPPQHISWLQRVTAQVDLTVGNDVHTIQCLSAGGAHIVALILSWQRRSQPTQVPAAVAGLRQLTELSFAHNSIYDGWQHVPRQLLQLELEKCGLQQVPAALSGLTQLTKLYLTDSEVEGGWQHLPQQLQQLWLPSCSLEQLPAELASLSQLTQLSLAWIPIQGGWQHLPRQLRKLDLSCCALQQVPAELAELGLEVTNCDDGRMEMAVPRGPGGSGYDSSSEGSSISQW